MKKFARRLAVTAGAVAVSIGLIGGTAGSAQADSSWPAVVKKDPTAIRDSSWPAA